MAYSSKQTAALTTAIATTPEILYEEFESGMVLIPTGSSITTLTWWACHEVGGSYLPAKATAVSLTVTPRTYVTTVQTVAQTGAYPIPAELTGAVGLKIVANAAGTVYLSLKQS